MNKQELNAAADALEELIYQLRQTAQAYPEDVFGPITEAERQEHGGLISRASAGMGRHLGKLLTKAADALQATLLPEQGPVIDLDQEDWKAIKQAASESPWMPPEYMMNDWVSDLCAYLRGTLHPPQPGPVDELLIQAAALEQAAKAIFAHLDTASDAIPFLESMAADKRAEHQSLLFEIVTNGPQPGPVGREDEYLRLAMDVDHAISKMLSSQVPNILWSVQKRLHELASAPTP